jgi:hypothetical protein
MMHAKVISKASSDGGRSWVNFTVHTPLSHSHGAAIYDRVAKQVVLQYQYHPNPRPVLNSSYLQRVSRDDGLASHGPGKVISMRPAVNFILNDSPFTKQPGGWA